MSRAERRPWSWVEYDPMRSEHVPTKPGCYAIYVDGVIAYVGQASNLRRRMWNHKIRHAYSNQIITPWGFFKEVRLKARVYRRYGQWAASELRLIRRLHPKFNKRGRVVVLEVA